jgi:hypothetical protein
MRSREILSDHLYSFWTGPRASFSLIRQAHLIYSSYPLESFHQIAVWFHFIFLAVIIDQGNQAGLSLGQELQAFVGDKFIYLY